MQKLAWEHRTSKYWGSLRTLNLFFVVTFKAHRSFLYYFKSKHFIYFKTNNNFKFSNWNFCLLFSRTHFLIYKETFAFYSNTKCVKKTRYFNACTLFPANFLALIASSEASPSFRGHIVKNSFGRGHTHYA